MEANKTQISVSAEINCPVSKVWQAWNSPEHITQWNAATPDWHCPKADVDLRVDGRFSSIMAARDGSFEFDFNGVYTEVTEHASIRYEMPDGRKVHVKFEDLGGKTLLTETFDPESMNPHEMQQAGWQSILDNFKKHVESLP